MSQPAILEIDSVTKLYGDFTALHPIKVGVQEGEFVALVGPSGSGKSTLLKCIAGCEDVSGGDLRIAGVSMKGVSPADRPTSMVFQRLALFPHKTIAENIAFPLKLRKLPKAEIKRLHRELGVTFVHVTHDLEEAMMLADRICVMNAGQLEQVGSPYDIYYRPETKFVAGFISETDLMEVTVSGTGGDIFSFNVEALALTSNAFPAANALDAIPDGPATLMVRPERLRPVKPDTAAPDFTIPATVTEYFVKGSTTQFVCEATANDGTPMRMITELRGETSLPYGVGDALTLGFDAADAFIFKDKG